jgi:hypothetical protein
MSPKIITIILIIIFFICITYFNKNQYYENFNLLDTGTETNDCSSKTLKSCTNYSNCGIATMLDGSKECIPGDIEGPFYSLNTQFDKWTYRDEYDGTIFNEKGHNDDYDIYATFYPIYDVFYPSPTTMSVLFI